MALCITFSKPGGPEALELHERELPPIGPGDVVLRQTAVGVNFIDVYHRSGVYTVPELPSGLGVEAAGVITRTGSDVPEHFLGQRAAYAGGKLGAYASERVVPFDRLLMLPSHVLEETAAACLLKGMTVEYLVCRTAPVTSEHVVVWHAAAGGVGLLACQWLRSLGATVIGTVSSPAKAALAHEHGCTHALVGKGALLETVRSVTGGRGADFVFDSVGKDTFELSLECLKPRGMLVSFGNASGKVPPFDILRLSEKGSLFLTRPTMFHYTASRQELELSASRVFDMLESRAIKVEIGQRYPLEEARKAHEDLQARRTVGSSILLP